MPRSHAARASTTSYGSTTGSAKRRRFGDDGDRRFLAPSVAAAADEGLVRMRIRGGGLAKPLAGFGGAAAASPNTARPRLPLGGDEGAMAPFGRLRSNILFSFIGGVGSIQASRAAHNGSKCHLEWLIPHNLNFIHLESNQQEHKWRSNLSRNEGPVVEIWGSNGHFPLISSHFILLGQG